MKYFAMIDGERKGPYTLEQLIDAGVRPDTYIWSKDMVDWQHARYVADVCRAFRQRLAGLPVTESGIQKTEPEPAEKGTMGNIEDVPVHFRHIVRKSGTEVGKLPEPESDLAQPPKHTLVPAVLVTLFCFPVTGICAIYYSIQSRKLWLGSDELPAEQRYNLRKESHSLNNMAKMWIGITFFLGLILYAFLFRMLS